MTTASADELARLIDEFGNFEEAAANMTIEGDEVIVPYHLTDAERVVFENSSGTITLNTTTGEVSLHSTAWVEEETRRFVFNGFEEL